ncbi:hypothetical protein ACFLT1_06290 [Bacteroidota bacterium]
MKRMYIFLSIMILSTALLKAQETKSNSFGMNLGMGNLQKQDLIFSPFIIKDWSPLNILLDYEHSGKVDQKVSLRFGQSFFFVGEPFSYYYRDIELEKWAHSTSNLDLNYSLTKSLVEKNNWKISAGGRYRNRFQITDYAFGEAGQFSYNLSYGLDALLNVEYKSGKHSFDSEFALPLFSFLARSPYTAQDDAYLERIMVHGGLKIFANHLKSATFQSWRTSKMVDLNLSYKYALNEKWDLGITYFFAMNRHNTPVPYTSIQNIIYLGTTLKF